MDVYNLWFPCFKTFLPTVGSLSTAFRTRRGPNNTLLLCSRLSPTCSASATDDILLRVTWTCGSRCFPWVSDRSTPSSSSSDRCLRCSDRSDVLRSDYRTRVSAGAKLRHISSAVQREGRSKRVRGEVDACSFSSNKSKNTWRGGNYLVRCAIESRIIMNIVIKERSSTKTRFSLNCRNG